MLITRKFKMKPHKSFLAGVLVFDLTFGDI